MEITITFKDGPIEAEINASEGDDYDEVLTKLSDFTENYSQTTNWADENRVDDAGEEEHAPQRTATVESLDDIHDNELYRVIKRGRVDGDKIQELPRIVGDVDGLADTGQERVLNAATIILTILDDIHGMDKMKTSDLKQAISDSGLNIDNWDHIDRLDEEDIYLNRRGKGASATTQIRPPGKDAAYELITELIS